LQKDIKSVRLVKPHFSQTPTNTLVNGKDTAKNGKSATSLFGAGKSPLARPAVATSPKR
jgi:hypothetical protein